MKTLRPIFGYALVLLMAVPLIGQADDLTPPPPEDRSEMAPMCDIFWAQAQGGQGPGHGPGWRGRMGERMERMKQLEQLRMLKMLELLELTEEQEVPFLTAFNAMRREHRQIEESNQITTDSLAQELRDGSASEARINSLVDRIMAFQQQEHEKMMEFVDQSRELLSVEQVGKLVIFQRRFESELLERIGRFRQGRGSGSGGPEGLSEDDG